MALTYTTDFKGQAIGVSATITSNSFTANTGDFITIAACYADNPDATAWTVSNTGTAITWTKNIETNTGANCKVVVWSGTVGATPPTTVSVQSTAGTATNGSKALFTAIHTGVHTVTPLPAGNLFSGTGGTDVTQAITPTSTGSALWMLVGDWSQTNSFAAAASCTLAATAYNEAGQQTVVPIQPTINPRTDAASFTIGESDTAGTIAWAAWEVQSESNISNYNPRRLNTRDLNKKGFRSNVLRRGVIAWRESVYRDLNPQATNPTVAYSLLCDAGSYSLSGQNALLKYGRSLTCAAGAYALTGQNALLKVAHKLICSAGSYSLSGQIALLKITRQLVCSAGSYALTGQAANLTYARHLTCDAGAYTLTGNDALLKITRQLVCSAGAYSLSGQAATLTYARHLVCSAGAYDLTGQAATLTYTPGVVGPVAYSLTCSPGSYALTGQDALLKVSHSLTCSAGSYALAGQDALLKVAHQLTCSPGAYNLTGLDAILLHTGKIDYSLLCEPGSYDYIGNNAVLEYTPPSTADHGVVHGIYYQDQKRKKRRGKSKLDKLLDKSIAEYKQQLKGFVKSDRPAVKKIVEPFIIDDAINKESFVDYPSLQADIDAIRALMIEYQKFLVQQDEEEILILLLAGI